MIFENLAKDLSGQSPGIKTDTQRHEKEAKTKQKDGHPSNGDEFLG